VTVCIDAYAGNDGLNNHVVDNDSIAGKGNVNDTVVRVLTNYSYKVKKALQHRTLIENNSKN
jgi:hypothetical protein